MSKMNYNYKEVLDNSTVKERYEIIDQNNNYYMSHGIKHIKNVINICNKLCNLLDINYIDRDNLLIAASLHDIGAYDGRDNHAHKSAEFAKQFLKDKMDEKNIAVIYNIIDRHSWETNKENILEEIICFADKLDFTKERLEDNYQKKYGFTSVLDDLEDIVFEIIDDTFIIKFVTNNKLTIERLCSEKENYGKGILINVSTFGKWIDKEYKVFFDNTLVYSGVK